jgi:hypothetical protein
LGFGRVCVSSGLYLVERLAVGAALHLAQDSRLRREISRDVDGPSWAVFDFALPLVVSAALLAPDVKALLMSIEGFLGPEDSLRLEQRLIDDGQPGERERELLRRCLTLSEAFLNGVVMIDALRAEEPGYRDNPVLSSLLTEPPLWWRSGMCESPREADFGPVFGGTTGVPCVVQLGLLRKTWCFSDFLGAVWP